MDVTKVHSFLRQAEQAAANKGPEKPLQAFADLLAETSRRSLEAGAAAERYLTTGEGDLHQVQIQLAKADVSFRFLVEVRNRLTEAYQEISRMTV